MDVLEKGKPHEAYPSFWAPFVLVGEGAPAERRSPKFDGNRNKMGLGVIDTPEVERNSIPEKSVNDAGSETIATRTEPQTAASRTVPLPKRRPWFARKSRKRGLGKVKVMNWPSWFWEASVSRVPPTSETKRNGFIRHYACKRRALDQGDCY